MSRKVANGLKKVVCKGVYKMSKTVLDMTDQSRVGTPCRLRCKRVKRHIKMEKKGVKRKLRKKRNKREGMKSVPNLRVA